MDDTKVVAIVGNSITYKDNDAIVRLLTRGQGNLLATAKSVKKPEAKLKYAASIFNVGKYVLCGRSNTIKECIQIEGFSELCEDVEKYYIGCYILENFAKINNKSSETSLFDDVIDVLTKLTYGNLSSIDAERDFLLSVLKSGGMDNTFTKCTICGGELKNVGYDVEAGIVCDKCLNSTQTIMIPKEVKNYYCGHPTKMSVKSEAILLLQEIIYYYMGIRISKNKYGNLKDEKN